MTNGAAEAASRTRIAESSSTIRSSTLPKNASVTCTSSRSTYRPRSPWARNRSATAPARRAAVESNRIPTNRRKVFMAMSSSAGKATRSAADARDDGTLRDHRSHARNGDSRPDLADSRPSLERDRGVRPRAPQRCDALSLPAPSRAAQTDADHLRFLEKAADRRSSLQHSVRRRPTGRRRRARDGRERRKARDHRRKLADRGGRRPQYRTQIARLRVRRIYLA